MSDLAALTMMDLGNEDFGDESELEEDGVIVPVRYIEKVLPQLKTVPLQKQSPSKKGLPKINFLSPYFWLGSEGSPSGRKATKVDVRSCSDVPKTRVVAQ
ncbi:hypothetical protein GJ744_005850 [Endocarpon pusillum]|uniref:Uncharacterized protein n=1 Tax=Endocarpon pusillum TaxID=364733 RepID=A0A8H7A4F8_9EURO|nr:hypothetical protein GJ744_005850 [Endocarpon pusillum]